VTLPLVITFVVEKTASRRGEILTRDQVSGKSSPFQEPFLLLLLLLLLLLFLLFRFSGSLP